MRVRAATRTDALRVPARTPRPGLAARALIVLGVGIALTIPVARAGGAPADELSSKLASARAEAERLGSRADAVVLALAEARKEAQLAAGRESELASTLAQGRRRSAVLAERLGHARNRLAQARARLERARGALGERLAAIYKSGEASGVDVLLRSDGFEDLATRADLLGRIQDADLALAERVGSLRTEIAESVERLARAKERSDALNSRVDAARSQIAAARAAAEARAADAQAAKRSQEAGIAALDRRMAGYSKRIERLERAAEAVPATAPAPAPAATEPAADGPFNGWAIPEAIVMCESGGNFSALNPSSGAGGAYQILPSTWEAYGGSGLPHRAPPAEQHRVAALIWADSGPAAWSCAA